MSEHRFPYKWKKTDLNKVEGHGHKVFSTFSCGGGSSFGYKMAGFDVIGFNEIDKEMVELYKANHTPKYAFHEPIQDFKDRDELPEELMNIDILDGSPPCFAAGTPVLTERGVLPIEQVKVGDLVLTHKGRWRPVVDTMNRVSPTVMVEKRIEVTPEHRFYTRTPEKKVSEARNLGEPEWTEAKDIQGKFTALPIDFGELGEIAPPEGFEYNKPFWYMVGRWLGDGWIRYQEARDDIPYLKRERYLNEQLPCSYCEEKLSRPHKRYPGLWTSYCSEECRAKFKNSRRRLRGKNKSSVIICCSYDESDELQERMEEVGRHICSSKQRTTIRKEINSKSLVLWMTENFGKGCKGKTMPGFVLSMNKEWRESLLEGYLDADGYEAGEGFYTVTSVGLCLLSAVRLLASSLGKTTSIMKSFDEGTCVIEGRLCNRSEAWTLSIHEDDGRYTDVSGIHRWRKIRREVVPASELTTVYDLTVEEDHSFIVDGYVVHNCSTFSMAGSREEVWGKEKKFREGQAEQVLSDLFFDYLDVVKKMQPKVSVAENVKGMILGKAKGYCKLVRDRYNEMGYDVQLFLFNSATMGVPQLRERVFFIARKKELGWKNLVMDFNEKPVSLREMSDNLPFQDLEGTEPTKADEAFWKRTRAGDSYSTVANGSYFNHVKLSWDKPTPTITAGAADCLNHPEEMRKMSWVELSLAGSYPYDYDYVGRPPKLRGYCIGMSVPPVMTANIAAQIAQQWFGVDKESIDKPWRQS